MLKKIILIGKQYGGREDVATFLIMIIVLFFFNNIIKKKGIRLVSSVISALFIVAQLSSLYFTQSFIGYQFFLHFDLYEINSLIHLYNWQILFIIVLFISLSALYYKSTSLIEISFLGILNKSFISKIFALLIALGLFSKSLTRSGFLTDTKSLWITLTTSNAEIDPLAFKKILSKYHMDDYVTPDQIQCTDSGKNIIIISLESMERSFLEGKFNELTPNLQRLKNNWNYLPIEQNAGSEWTSGSLYTSLTGFPAYFGRGANDIFQKTFDTSISSISHIFKKNDRDLIFMSGDANFSGTKDMLLTFKFDEILDKYNTKNTGNESKYGIRDKDLFELAKNKVTTLSKNNQPFVLYISTTDTHFPNGIYDERMGKYVTKKDSQLEFMVAAVDYMVGDFIAHIKENKLLSNTIIYIFPDHIKMGDPTIFDDPDTRGLYMITNANKQALCVDPSTKYYQIDLPKLILEGAEIKHNLHFFTDYISKNKNAYILENIAQITEINTHGVKIYNEKPLEITSSKNYELYKKDTLRYIAHAGGIIDGFTYTNSMEALDLSYSKGFRLFELDILKSSDGEYVAAHDWEHWSEITGYTGNTPVDKQTFLSYKMFDKYTPLDITAINDWFFAHKDAVLITDKINEPSLFSQKFIDPQRLMMELFDLSAVKEGINKIKSAMPSQNIIAHYQKKDVKKLHNIGVKNIAVSREFIRDHKELLMEFKKNNIKVYAYNINFQDGIDEDYVSRYEMDYIYGIYADKWEF